MVKGPNNFRLCQNRPEYRKLWDDLVKKETPEEFSLLQKAAAFKDSAIVHIENGRKRTTQEQKQERLDICNTCEYRKENVCKLCGCFLSAKATWATSECPAAKWPILEDK
jgi:hypothetical protein